MFLLAAIWKRLSAGMVIAFLLGSGLFAAPLTAQASGESYSWTDTTDTAITASGGSYASPIELKKGTNDGQEVQFTGSGKIVCSTATADASFILRIKTSDYQKTNPTPSSGLTVTSNCQSSSFDAQPKITGTAATSASASDTPGSCKGSFAWIACPLINDVASFISDISIKVITPFLHVNAISSANTPGLYQAWSGIKNFSEVLFIIIFLIIIFSTVIGTGLDQYTIKRMLPRVIAGAIMVQFSFLFSGIIIDLGNILGNGVAQVITVATAGTPDTSPTAGGFLTNIPTILGTIVAGTAIWASLPLVLPTIGIMLLSVLAVLFTFAARYILIAILVAVSPLAFVAWILPNTEHYFKQWYKTFIRLILMYPIIIGLLTIGGRLGDILGSTNEVATNWGSGLFIDILKPFIVVIIFLAIPLAFKWAGGIMHQAHNTFSVLSKGTSKGIRESDSHKRRREETEGRRIDRMRKFSERSRVKRYTNSSAPGIFGASQRAFGTGLLSARALSVGGGPASTKSIEQRYGKSFRHYDKELDELNEIPVDMFNKALTAHYGTGTDRVKARTEVLEKAPILMDYLSTSSGRAAILARSNAAKMFNGKNFREIAKDNPAELERMLRTAAKNNFKERINVFGSDFEHAVAGDPSTIPAGRIFRSMARGWKAKTIADDIDVSVFADATGVETGENIYKKPIYTPDARSQSFATVIAESSSPLAFGEAFNPGNKRNPLDKGKKVQILQMLANNKSIFASTDNGKKIRDAIIQEMRKPESEEIYDEFLKEGMGLADYIVAPMTTAQKLAEIERFLR